jgi:hypothetical protein
MAVCRSTVNTLLVGLHRIGIVGLRQALMEVDQAGLTHQKDVVDRLAEILLPGNYIPDPDNEQFRRALWREYLRYRNEDFSNCFSRVNVTVQGTAGEERDDLVEALESILHDLELEPVVEFAPAPEDGPDPYLIIDNQSIGGGFRTGEHLRQAIHKSISDW